MRGLATIPRPTAPLSAPSPLRSRTRYPRRIPHLGLGVAARRATPESDRILVTRAEAARMLGMSLSHFQRHVQPYLRCVYIGQLRQYRPEDLSTWAEQAAYEPGGAVRV